MNNRGGYQFFTPPAPGGVPPFLSFVPPPSSRPPAPYPYPGPPPPFPFGFPMPIQEIDPNRIPVPLPPPLQHPLPSPSGNGDAVLNFFQQASMASIPAQPAPLPFAVRSGVYDLRALEEQMMVNSLKERPESSPQVLHAQPHVTSSVPTNGDRSGVVSDDPTTYWLGNDAGNEFAQSTSSRPASSTSSSTRSNRRTRNNNNNNNINNNNINNINNVNNNSNNNNSNNNSPNNNHNVITSPPTNGINFTNGTDSPSSDVNAEDSPMMGGPSNGARNNIKKGYPFTGPSTSTVTSDFPNRNNNNRGNRGIHTSRNSTKRYVPKPNDATFKTTQDGTVPADSVKVDLAIPPDSNMDNLAKLLQESIVTEIVTRNSLPEHGDLRISDFTEGRDGELDMVSPLSPAQEGVNGTGNDVLLRQRPKGRTYALPRRELIEMISVDCKSVFEALQPPLTDLHAKLAFLSRLQRIVEGYWPQHNPKLHMFGSSANEMCFKNGDIDMCLTIDKGAGQEKTVVNKLSNLLERRGMTSVLALPHARVPIVKFKDPKSRFLCDICINNSLALQNTRLVADYSKIDPRVRPLAYLVKYWAKRRGINHPYQGTLSSYAYINLVINFLQTRDPPVLPCLQSLAANQPDRVIIDNFDCTYASPAPYIGFGEANTQSISELLCHFFHYYTNEFDIRNGVVSVRCGAVIAKKEKGWDSARLQRDNMLFAIEDPFETTHNLGRVVDKDGLHQINTELRRACVLLRNEGSFLSVCKERGVQ